MSTKRLPIDVIKLVNYLIPYVIIFVFLTSSSTGKYQAEKDAPQRAPAYFKDDSDIERYLQMYHTDVMLWRCKNAITRKWTGLPFDYIELYCEVLGKVKSIDLFHNWQKVKIGSRIQLIASPHHNKGKVYSHWMDFRIRINQATKKDAGSYIIRVKSPLGNRESQMIFLDISKKKQLFDPEENEVMAKKRWERRMRRRKQRRRRKRKRARARAKA